MSKTSYSLDDLLYLMQRLRDPDTGCPWDIKQNYQSITASTIEEAYEVVDAIERGDLGHLKEELGDLLFQTVFYAQFAKEDGAFTFHEIVDELTQKLLRRHPHVFPGGNLKSVRDKNVAPEQDDVKASWEKIKKAERQDKGHDGVLDDVPRTLPAILRAIKFQKRAAQVGFDWEKPEDIVEIVHGEMDELEQAMLREDSKQVEEELGDVMFSCINLARKYGFNAELVLRQANEKFERRVRFMESAAREANQSLSDLDLAELEALWDDAKINERHGKKHRHR